MASDACSICTADNLEELEQLGLAAQNGDISWRSAARDGGLNHHAKLQNHMERHYVDPFEVDVNDFAVELTEEVLRTKRLLLEKSRMAPVDVRPLYLTAIHNLDKLEQTKPSQQVLVAALKTITEMTGMKMEQQLMVEFAKYAFNPELDQASPATPIAAVSEVVETEAVEVSAP